MLAGPFIAIRWRSARNDETISRNVSDIEFPWRVSNSRGSVRTKALEPSCVSSNSQPSIEKGLRRRIGPDAGPLDAEALGLIAQDTLDVHA
jgi:hypothetical protein